MDKEIYNYIPHRKHMAIIDNILSLDKELFAVAVNINNESLLFQKEGVPSYCAIEYMAQSVAAYNTIFLEENKKTKIGFLAAVRNFKTTVAYFKENSQLKITVEPSLIVANSGSFNCKVEVENQVVATGRITAYVPTEVELDHFKNEGLKNE